MICNRLYDSIVYIRQLHLPTIALPNIWIKREQAITGEVTPMTISPMRQQLIRIPLIRTILPEINVIDTGITHEEIIKEHFHSQISIEMHLLPYFRIYLKRQGQDPITIFNINYALRHEEIFTWKDQKTMQIDFIAESSPEIDVRNQGRFHLFGWKHKHGLDYNIVRRLEDKKVYVMITRNKVHSPNLSSPV